jgi:hypothetical protein
MTGFFGIAAFFFTLGLANQLAKRRAERERIPPAKQL